MKIAYSCNDYYIPQTCISIISLCENNRNIEELSIYFIGKDVCDENIEILKNIVHNYGRELIYIPFENIAFDLNISSVGRHIETIYSKVFFSRIQGLDKIIYLDSDIIVDGSLEELWNIDLTDCYLGAVQTFCGCKHELGMPSDTPFFNDGMAIMNVDYCREHNLIEQTLRVIKDFNGNPPVLSEGALNKVCTGHVKYISLRWNCMAGILYYGLLNINYLAKLLTQYAKEDLYESCQHPVNIHYLAGFYNRPWFTPCSHPLKERYYYYQSLSPWKDTKPTHKPLPFKLVFLKKCIDLFGPRIILNILELIENIRIR